MISRIRHRTLLIALFLFAVATVTSCKKTPSNLIPLFFLMDAANPPTYTLGGQISGLHGSRGKLHLAITPGALSLQEAREEDLDYASPETNYTFSTALYTNESYTLEVSDHPRSPSEYCSLDSTGGLIDNADQTISLGCEGAYRITTTVSGLAGSGLSLSASNGDVLSISSSGNAEFPTPYKLSDSYQATIEAQPTSPWQTCSFSGSGSSASGTNSSKNDLQIADLVCTTNQYTVNVSISGLVNSGLQLSLNGTSREITSGTSSTSLGDLDSGSTYTVAVTANPVGESCEVFGGSGSISDSAVTVDVACTQYGYMVGGAVSNLLGTGLVVSYTGSYSGTKSVDAGRTGWYADRTYNHADTYNLSITGQPASGVWQNCVFASTGSAAGPSGTILESTGSVTNADITCTTYQYALSAGTITGLVESGLVLTVNGVDYSVASGATSASLGTWDSGTAYTVSVKTQPAHYTCSVSSGTGTIQNSDISSVGVSCSPNPYAVGGTISGLVNGDTVTVTDSESGGSAVLSNGTQQFANVLYGNNYNISAVPSTTAGYSSGVCTVTNGTGTVGGVVSNITVVCTPNTFTLALNVTDDGNLAAGTNELGISGSLSATVSAAASSVATANVTYGSTYTITLTQPPYSTCSVSSGSLSTTMPAANTTPVVDCTVKSATLFISTYGLGAGESITMTNTGTTGSIPGTISYTGTEPIVTGTGSASYGGTYQYKITSMPSGKICAVDGKQTDTVAGDVTTVVRCVAGYGGGSSVLDAPPARLNFFPYQGKSTTLISDSTTISGTYLNNCTGLSYYNGDVFITDVGSASDKRIIKYHVATGTTTVLATGLSGGPRHVVSDGSNLFYSDAATFNVVQMDLETGSIVKTFAMGSSFPSGLALDRANQILYVVMRGQAAVKKIDLSTGTITTLTTSPLLTNGSNGSEDLVLLNGMLYVATYNNNTIVKVDPGTEITTLYAGTTATAGHRDGPITSALFSSPNGITTDGTDLYIGENLHIRKIDVKKGIVSTIAGDTTMTNMNDGTGIAAGMRNVLSITTDGKSLYALTDTGPGYGALRKIVNNGLVGHWPLKGSPDDYSSDGANGPQATTTTGSPAFTGTDRYGNANGAYTFDNTDDVFKVSATNLPSGNESRTLCAWIKPTALADQQDGIATYGDGGTGTTFGLKTGSVNYKLQSWDNNGQVEFGILYSASSNWIHLCTVYDSSTSITKLYYNGNFSRSQSAHTYSTNTTGTELWIGQKVAGTGAYFKGSIADVRIYNRALDDSEINQLAQDADSTQVSQSYNTGPTGLLSHYQFTYDSSEGGPSYKDSGPLNYILTGYYDTGTTGKDGDSSGAMLFNGTSTYLATTSDAGLPMGTNPRTMCAWFKLKKYPSASETYAIAQYGTQSAGQKFALFITNDGTSIRTTLDLYSSDTKSLSKPPLNTWTHVCGTLNSDQTSLSLYINGKHQSTTNYSAGSFNTISNQLYIGAQSTNANYFPGAIDDVRIYNNALTSDQIRHLAQQIPDGLVAAYDFTDNGGSGDPLKDVSGWGADAVATGSPTISSDRFGLSSSEYNFASGDAFTITNPSHIGALSEATISFWMRITDPNYGTSTYVGNQYFVTIGGKLIKWDSSNFFQIYTMGSSVSFSDPVDYGYWQNITITNGAANGRKIYLNGADITSGTHTGVTFPDGNITIGGSSLVGSMDDVQIYNRVLSLEEIQALVRQPNKIISLSTSSNNGNLKSKDTIGTNGDNGIEGGDSLCQSDFSSGYKAMIVDGTNRVACSGVSGNCIDNGVKENVDWVLRPGITYVRSDGVTPVFTANENGVLAFGSFSTGITDSGASSLPVWTGLLSDWRTSSYNCNSWGNGSSSNKGEWAMSGSTGSTSIDNDNVDYLCDTSLHIYCVEQ